MRSTWTTHFFRYTAVTLPSRVLYIPRVMRTSSSLRIGIDRTPCRAWSSLERLALMSFLRASLWAPKWALRFLRRLEVTLALNFILVYYIFATLSDHFERCGGL